MVGAGAEMGYQRGGKKGSGDMGENEYGFARSISENVKLGYDKGESMALMQACFQKSGLALTNLGWDWQF